MPTRADSPDVTFSTFVVSLAGSALAHLGHVDQPAARPDDRDIALARHTIALIDLLAAKTRGNLDEAEQKLLAALQKELREKLAATAG